MTDQTDPYRLVISLGGVCQVAYQIEHRFGFRISGPFDWLVTPLGAIAKILGDGGARFTQALYVTNGGRTPLCANYGVSYHHDFPIGPGRHVMISAEAMEASRGKMRHKFDRLVELLGARPKTLFVRMSGHHDSAIADPYLRDPRPVTASDLNDLCRAIEGAFPGLDFGLAFVRLPEFTTLDLSAAELDPRVRIFDLEGDNRKEWGGHTKVWATVWDAYPIDLASDRGIARQFVGVRVEKEHMYV